MSIAVPLASGSPQAARAASRGVEAAPLLLALAVFALAAFAPAVLNDGDTWSHVATGEWILRHAAVPRTDPFSATFAGAPWTAHEWLSEMLFALAFRVAGWGGVMLLTGVAAGLATLVMAHRAARDLTGVPLIVVAALAASLLAPSLLARPHVLALPVLALWGAGLMEARRLGRAPSPALIPLMTLWANLHGGFALGLALVAPFAIEGAVVAPPESRTARIKAWGVFALASLAAALLTPFGVEGLLFPLKLVGIAHLANIGEWRPEDFTHPGPMEIGLLALLGFALTRPFRMALTPAALLVGLIHLALQHARHETLLAMLAPMLLAEPIARALALPSPAAPRRRWPLLAAATVAIGLAGARLALPVERGDGPTAPMTALQAVPETLRQRPVLNDYAFGGYLIWAGVRPFVDGRADMYGDDFLGRYERIAAGDADALAAALKRYGVAWTIFAPTAHVAALMDREPGWRRLYADRFAVVHVREEAQGAEGARRGE
ncbi:MAG: hypothetical protein JO234_09660 [Hyphomicrobiales bacterium]|nr:hypothetical protein [Hyphomicrobiales bacterium]